MSQIEITNLACTAIIPSSGNPRTHFGEAELLDLSRSIKEKGLLQPILVKPTTIDGKFQIIAGERRWRAAQMAGLKRIAVVVRRASAGETLELAIIENVQRADLNQIDEACGYNHLINKYGYTQEVVAKVIGKSRSHVANSLRLLQLPLSIQKMVYDGILTAGHARTLVGLSDAEQVAKRIVAGNLTVRGAERLRQRRDNYVSTRRPRKGFRVRDGRALAEVSWDEIPRLIRINETELVILKDIRRRFRVAGDGSRKLGSILRQSELDALSLLFHG